eukprot:2989164-Karenia_brevis.AAC.1
MVEVVRDLEEKSIWQQESAMKAYCIGSTRAVRAASCQEHSRPPSPSPQRKRVVRKKADRARREATMLEKRQYQKQFRAAKGDEVHSWKDENLILESLGFDCEERCQWKSQRCTARWVLKGFKDKQNWFQTDSPTSARPGFRLQCQQAAIARWAVDLKTASLQGEQLDNNRSVACQLPPEAGYPPYMGARLLKSAYGLKDASCLWWNRLDRSLKTYGAGSCASRSMLLCFVQRCQDQGRS